MDQSNQNYQEFLCNAKSRSLIASEYGIHRKTLAAWIKRYELPIQKGNLCIKAQELIYETFGTPILSFTDQSDVPKSAKEEQRGPK
ncbi:MAG: hypothetical protein RL329_1375 [Bacteroidota bacterium]|jgi:hypothetical protein